MQSVEALKSRIARLDQDEIDRLYGLPPVYEPGTAGAVCPEERVAYRCPYCGERLETLVDVTGGERSYIEDCQVCCRPVELGIELAEDGALVAVRVQRSD
jgi:hypothetical protein